MLLTRTMPGRSFCSLAMLLSVKSFFKYSIVGWNLTSLASISCVNGRSFSEYKLNVAPIMLTFARTGQCFHRYESLFSKSVFSMASSSWDWVYKDEIWAPSKYNSLRLHACFNITLVARDWRDVLHSRNDQKWNTISGDWWKDTWSCIHIADIDLDQVWKQLRKAQNIMNMHFWLMLFVGISREVKLDHTLSIFHLTFLPIQRD